MYRLLEEKIILCLKCGLESDKINSKCKKDGCDSQTTELMESTKKVAKLLSNMGYKVLSANAYKLAGAEDPLCKIRNIECDYSKPLPSDAEYCLIIDIYFGEKYKMNHLLSPLPEGWELKESDEDNDSFTALCYHRSHHENAVPEISLDELAKDVLWRFYNYARENIVPQECDPEEYVRVKGLFIGRYD